MLLTSEAKIIKSGTQNQSVSITPHNVHTLGHLDQKVISKFITNQLIFPLIDLKSPLKTSYWRTWRCCQTIFQEDKRLISKYCDQRWCVICNRIRTAQNINSYYDQVQSIEDRHFVTISRTNVSENDLKAEIDILIKDFAKCIRIVKKLLKTKIKAIRKLEATYNITHDNYHPHIHIITSGHIGNTIIQVWRKLQGNKSGMLGQNIKPSNDSDIIELFKYTTKLFKIDADDKTPEGKQKIVIDVKPLDKIFQVLKNRKTFQAYGMKKPILEQIDKDKLKGQEYEFLDSGIEIWYWEDSVNNYVTALGEILTPTNPSNYYSIFAK